MIGAALAWLTRRRSSVVAQSQDEAAGLRNRLSTAQSEIARLQAQLRQSEESRQRLIAAGAQANPLQPQVAKEQEWHQKWSEGDAEIEQPVVKQPVPEMEIPSPERSEQGWQQKWSEGEAKIEQPRVEPPAVEVKPPLERSGQRKDRLEEINGIGPVFARRFNEAGIYTFAELAELTPERVHEIVHTEEWQKIDPDAWIAEAKERAQVPAGL
jgi:predicted flap endonuclease-1-like 5' DNA nuclease